MTINQLYFLSASQDLSRGWSDLRQQQNMDVDEDEGLRLLLGGVSVFDLAEVDWSDVEEENSQEKWLRKER